MKNLSVVLGGDRVSVLMNASSEPETEEMVTLVSLLDKRLILLHQVTSTVFVVIRDVVEGLTLMVQVKERGVGPPANSEPRETMMLTFGVDTGEIINHFYHTATYYIWLASSPRRPKGLEDRTKM